MSDKSFLKRFDIFKKMPRDLTEPTNCGALGKYKYFYPDHFLISFSSFNNLHFHFGGLKYV